VDAALATPANANPITNKPNGSDTAHATIIPVAAPPTTSTRRSPSRSAATPAPYDPSTRPTVNAATVNPANAADRSRSFLMNPVSVGMPCSTTDTPTCATRAAPSSRHAADDARAVPACSPTATA
jgi:hypothetical protein